MKTMTRPILILGLIIYLTCCTALAEQKLIPQICESPYDISAEMSKKLAEIAITEAEAKNVSLEGYNSVLTLVYPDIKYKNGHLKRKGYFGVRFSPYHCEELGLDGGGFDVEIDPITFAVLRSRVSAL
jgi:hypothetical protein